MSHIKYFLISLGCLILIACSHKERAENEIYIGTITGPETQIMEVAKNVAASRYGLKLTIITFEDYVVPNTALAEGEIDANMFQHQPYLELVLRKQKYALTPIGKMFIYPMGMYSKKHKKIEDLPQGATIAIPNDPSNAARALRLLAKAKLISLPQANDLELTPQKIISNPHQFQFKEMAAAQLPRILHDVDAAIINTNYAVPAGLYPHKNAILTEDKDSPYVNLVVARTSEINKEKYHKLMEALHSPEVEAEAAKLFHHQAIKGW